jgi:hypothetical protein
MKTVALWVVTPCTMIGSETLRAAYQITLYHNPEDHNLSLHQCHENR